MSYTDLRNAIGPAGDTPPEVHLTIIPPDLCDVDGLIERIVDSLDGIVPPTHIAAVVGRRDVVLAALVDEEKRSRTHLPGSVRT